jgi:hypothetical protein
MLKVESGEYAKKAPRANARGANFLSNDYLLNLYDPLVHQVEINLSRKPTKLTRLEAQRCR